MLGFGFCWIYGFVKPMYISGLGIFWVELALIMRILANYGVALA